jgi:hypothetical protein
VKKSTDFLNKKDMMWPYREFLLNTGTTFPLVSKLSTASKKLFVLFLAICEKKSTSNFFGSRKIVTLLERKACSSHKRLYNKPID